MSRGVQYTPAQRRAAIERCEMVGVREAEKDLGINSSLLHRWQGQFVDPRFRYLFDDNISPPRRRRTRRPGRSHDIISLGLQKRIYEAAKRLGMSAEEWFKKLPTLDLRPLEFQPIKVYKPKWWQIWR